MINLHAFIALTIAAFMSLAVTSNAHASAGLQASTQDLQTMEKLEKKLTSTLSLVHQDYEGTVSGSTALAIAIGIFGQDLLDDRKRVGREIERTHRRVHKEVKRWGQDIFGW